MKAVVEFNDGSEADHEIINFGDIQHMGYGLVLINDTYGLSFDYDENEVKAIKISEL